MADIKGAPPKEFSLYAAGASYRDIVHTRIILQHRLRDTQENELVDVLDSILTAEKQMETIMVRGVKKVPIHYWIVAQTGLSYKLAAQLIGIIQPISRFRSYSALHSYAGMGVIEMCIECEKRYYPPEIRGEKIIHIAQRLMAQYEKKIVREGSSDFTKKATQMLCNCKEPVIKKMAPRPKAGVLLDYNPDLRALLYNVGWEFIMQGGYYRGFYDNVKAKYAARPDLAQEVATKKGRKVKVKVNGKTQPGETTGTAHINNMARRYAAKRFLTHLQARWRELEGLPPIKPYVIDRLGHADYIPPPPPNVDEIRALMKADAEKREKEYKKELDKAKKDK